MNSIASLLSSHAGEAGIFTAAVLFTVASPLLFDAWITRGASVARARAAAVPIILVFLCMAAGGVVDYAIVGKLNFLSLAFFLNGAVGLSILPTVLWRRGRDQELRRMTAHDL